MRIARIVLALGLLSMAAGHASAAEKETIDPDALKAARELSALISKDTLAQMTAQLSTLMWPGVEQKLKAKQTVSAEQASSLRAEFERIQLDYVTKLMEQTPVIYARHFTAAELREITAFYKTPVGQKALTVLPQITTETMALLMPQIPKLQDDVMKSFGKILRKRGLEI